MFGDCSVSKASVEASCQRMEQQLRSQTNTVKVVHQLRQVHLHSLPCMEQRGCTKTAAAFSSVLSSALPHSVWSSGPPAC